jgi:hypothetical protein
MADRLSAIRGRASPIRTSFCGSPNWEDGGLSRASSRVRLLRPAPPEIERQSQRFVLEFRG